jgi:hypothetical protein
MKLLLSLKAYNPLENCLNLTILCGICTNIAKSSFESIMTQNLLVISLRVMMFVIEFSLYHTSSRCGILHLFCEFIGPPLVVISNALSASRIFVTYFGLQKTVSTELLSNRINSFMFPACANEQCNPAHPTNGSSFLLDAVLSHVLLSLSSFNCTCCCNLLIAHSSLGIFALLLQSGDLCPGLPQQ